MVVLSSPLHLIVKLRLKVRLPTSFISFFLDYCVSETKPHFLIELLILKLIQALPKLLVLLILNASSVVHEISCLLRR
jgi:hypothetical protein